MLGHSTKSCYIFKDVLQAVIDVKVIKLRPKQKKVTANMTSLQFGKDLPLVPTGVVPIPTGELRVINTNPHHQEEKGFCPCPYSLRRVMWVHPDLLQTQQ